MDFYVDNFFPTKINTIFYFHSIENFFGLLFLLRLEQHEIPSQKYLIPIY